MTVTTLLRPKAGDSVASIGVVDVGVGQDTALVQTPTPALEVLPQLLLEMSYDAPSGPIYREAVTVAPAEVYYRLSETSGAVIDQRGALNLVVSGGVTRGVAGMLSGEPDNLAYDFNGTTGYLSSVDNAIFDADEITLEAIIRPDVVSGTRSTMRRITTSDLEVDIWALRIVNGLLQFLVWDAANVGYTYWSSKPLSSGVEYHVMLIARENQIEFYIDGQLSDFIPKSWVEMKKAVTPNEDTSLPPIVLETRLVVGAGQFVAGAATEFFDGKIDEPAIYTFALPAEAPLYHHTARSAPTSHSWTALSTDSGSKLKDIVLKQGRQDIFRDIETGMLSGTLMNQDRRFDPSNTASPHYPNLKPARPVRLSVIKSGVHHDLFRGDVEAWPQDWRGRENDVPITVLDALDVLARAEVLVTGPVELTGQRLHRILDAAAWPRELRDISTGSTLVQAWEDEQGTAKVLAQRIVDSESGHMYVDGRGYVVFRDRLARANAPTMVTFSNIPDPGELPFVEADVDEEKDQIKNDIQITVTDGPTFVAQDVESILQHRIRSFKLELPLHDHTEGFIKAHWLLQLYKVPFQRIAKVVIEPQMDSLMWQHALGRKIGDKARFKIFPPGESGPMIDLYAHIEYIEHKFVVGRWTTTWLMSPADVNEYWILGTSQLGIDTKLAY